VRTEDESNVFTAKSGMAVPVPAISTRGVAASRFVADQLVIKEVVLGLIRHADTHQIACRSVLEIAHERLPRVTVNEPWHALAVQVHT